MGLDSDEAESRQHLGEFGGQFDDPQPQLRTAGLESGTVAEQIGQSFPYPRDLIDWNSSTLGQGHGEPGTRPVVRAFRNHIPFYISGIIAHNYLA